MTSRWLLRGACLAATLAFLAPPSVTRADTTYPFEGTTKGVFDPNSGGAGNFITWGSTTGNNQQSSLTYTGESFNITNVGANPSALFLVGGLAFYDGNVVKGTGDISVDLTIALNLIQPDGAGNPSLETQTLGVTLKTNGDGTLTLGSGFRDLEFPAGGVNYTLSELGWSSSSTSFVALTDSKLSVTKGSTGHAYLWAKVSAVPVSSNDPPAVPEPASIAVVAVAGLLGFAHAARRRRAAIA